MKVHSTNLAFHMWDELTIVWNDLTILWNDLTSVLKKLLNLSALNGCKWSLVS